ncbi:MAG TPA: LysR family transcriptional regulator [Actinocrinis sp.]|nr:LysR family transcriptional regulator [Actinocrinis sp.]
MELRQLVYFEAVARCGGFSRAGEELRIAQPAVSAQIRRLEAELGTALLRRTTRQVALTAAGELFLVRVRRVLAELDLARGELDELANVLRGRVRIGATPILGSLDLPAAMAGFHQTHPGVVLRLRVGLVADLCRELDDDGLDLVLGPLHEDLDADGYVSRPLAEEGLVLATPPGSAAAAKTIRTLADVSGEPFVCLPPGSGLHAILLAEAAWLGFTPRIEFEASTPASVRDLVAAGLGVALLAESAARAPGPPITLHRLADAPRHPPIGCILPAGRPVSPAVQAFLRQIAARRAPDLG